MREKASKYARENRFHYAQPTAGGLMRILYATTAACLRGKCTHRGFIVFTKSILSKSWPATDSTSYMYHYCRLNKIMGHTDSPPSNDPAASASSAGVHVGVGMVHGTTWSASIRCIVRTKIELVIF